MIMMRGKSSPMMLKADEESRGMWSNQRVRAADRSSLVVKDAEASVSHCVAHSLAWLPFEWLVQWTHTCATASRSKNPLLFMSCLVAWSTTGPDS